MAWNLLLAMSCAESVTFGKLFNLSKAYLITGNNGNLTLLFKKINKSSNYAF